MKRCVAKLHTPRQYISGCLLSTAFVPHTQRIADDACAAKQGEQDAFFAGVGAIPIHAKAKCEKQADGNPQHLVRLLLIAVERVGFAEHDVKLPQRGDSEQRDGDKDKQSGEV